MCIVPIFLLRNNRWKYMSIYQHFRPEERGFIDQALNWKDYVENNMLRN